MGALQFWRSLSAHTFAGLGRVCGVTCFQWIKYEEAGLINPYSDLNLYFGRGPDSPRRPEG